MHFQGVRLKLVELGADRPNDGIPVPGGVYRREIVSVPAIGLGSPRQNIPRGVGVTGATTDRQFTDQNQGTETRPHKGKSCQHSIVRMRRRPLGDLGGSFFMSSRGSFFLYLSLRK